MESNNKEFQTNTLDNSYTNVKDIDGKIKKKKKKKKSKNRCSHINCNKKLNLATVQCKCKKKFCGLHRLPHQHKCDFVMKKDDKVDMYKCGLGGGGFIKVPVI